MNFLPSELEKFLTGLGEKKYRAKQIPEWICDKLVTDFSKMTSLSKKSRNLLSGQLDISLPRIIKKEISSDGTIKFLLELQDQSNIEMVLIPFIKKNTLCVSSQVGCKWNCSFCATGKMGFKRNLQMYEIISQILIAKKELKEQKLTNIVFMGMGEPLDNFLNLERSIRLLQDESCFGFSPRRITVSTSGLIPEIRRLSETGLKVKLAVSLNSAIQSKRDKLMPVSKVYPLTELKKALLDFRKKTNHRITFEYIMIKDVNMGNDDSKALRRFMGDISGKLNLISWNDVEKLPFESPSQTEIDSFLQLLKSIDSVVTFRRSRGQDIGGACGQLAARM